MTMETSTPGMVRELRYEVQVPLSLPDGSTSTSPSLGTHTPNPPSHSLTASPPHLSFSGSYGVRPHLGLQNCELSSLLQPLCGGSVCGVPVGVCVRAFGLGKKENVNFTGPDIPGEVWKLAAV